MFLFPLLPPRIPPPTVGLRWDRTPAFHPGLTPALSQYFFMVPPILVPSPQALGQLHVFCIYFFHFTPCFCFEAFRSLRSPSCDSAKHRSFERPSCLFYCEPPFFLNRPFQNPPPFPCPESYRVITLIVRTHFLHSSCDPLRFFFFFPFLSTPREQIDKLSQNFFGGPRMCS